MVENLAHTKWLCKYHVNIIFNKLEVDIIKIIKDLYKWRCIEIIEGHIMPVTYIYCSSKPKYSVSQVMGYTKEKSTTLIFKIQAWQ